jgi:hypothetical protein
MDLSYSKSPNTKNYYLIIRPKNNNPRRQALLTLNMQIKAKDLIKELK